MIKLSISKLNFSLPDNPLAQYASQLDAATKEIKELTRSCGTHSDKFKQALARIRDSVRQGRDLSSILQSPLEIRALAVLLNTDLASKIKLTPAVLNKIDQIRAKPSSLLLEAIYSHYLIYYDHLEDMSAVESWLLKRKKLRGELTAELTHLLSGNGPKWLAEVSRRERRDFDEQVRLVHLDYYRSGRFLMISKNIYYLDVLRGLKPNELNPILEEMQKQSVYDSRYDERSLLGHQILSILIEKAPVSGVSDVWLNVILAIGGDPRVSKAHSNFRKWWSQIDPKLTHKVQGWLSKLDLKLFLEALKDFSNQPGNEDLKRMYPARKYFIEGLLNKQLVTGTRLYLSSRAESYLRRTYKPEHLPSYSFVTDADKSVIHIQLDSVHLIEGSHNCRLWIYEALHPSAIVFDYSKIRVTYRSLTQGLASQMQDKGMSNKANITHHPPLGWQNKAIVTLRELNISIDPKDVLTPEDYRRFNTQYGA